MTTYTFHPAVLPKPPSVNRLIVAAGLLHRHRATAVIRTGMATLKSRHSADDVLLAPFTRQAGQYRPPHPAHEPTQHAELFDDLPAAPDEVFTEVTFP